MIGIDLKELLQNKLREWNEKDSGNFPISHTIFHASEAGHCPRSLFIKRTINPPLDERTLRVFKLGKLIHELIEKVLGEHTEQRVGFQTDLIEVWGQIDYFNRDKKLLYEFKTTSYILPELKPEHRAQINLYLGMTGTPTGKVIYINKHDLGITEFEVKYDEKLFWDTIRTFEYVSKKLKAGVNWKEVEHRESISCMFEPYRNYCSK